MKTLTTTILLAVCLTGVFCQTNLELVSNLKLDGFLNDIWGYTAPDGSEYALVCGEKGVYIIDISVTTDPQVVSVSPDSTEWFDIKTWGSYAYAIDNEDKGMLVIDLSNLPDSVEYRKWYNSGTGGPTFRRAHNCWIDEHGIGYLSGSDLNSGVAFIDFATMPGQPSYLGGTSSDWVHDVFVKGDIMFAAEGSSKIIEVYDVSDKSEPFILASIDVPGGYAHSAWLSENGKVLYVADEKPYSPISSFDISDLNDIRLLDEFRMPLRENVLSVPHNVFEKDGFLVISHYVDGAVIVDAHKPENLVQVGQYDTNDACYIYGGVFGVYPFFPSCLVAASDGGNGVFVFRPTYQRACYLEGKIKDAKTGLPLAGVTVKILSEDNNDGISDVVGNFKTGQLSEGNFEVVFKKDGYYGNIVPVSLNRAKTTEINVEMQALDYPKSLVVRDEKRKPLEAVSILIETADSNYIYQTNNDGLVSFPDGIESDYTIYAGRWGWLSKNMRSPVVPANEQVSIILEKGYEDNFIFDFGWTVYGDAEKGMWERGVPDDVKSTPCENLAPPSDDANDLGNSCYITGNEPLSIFTDTWIFTVNQVVYNGETILTSPILPLKSNYLRPQLSYSTWFVNQRLNYYFYPSYYGTFAPANDKLEIFIENGTESILLETITDTSLWRPSKILNLADLIEITDNMRLVIKTADTKESNHFLEAGFDNFKITEGMADEDFLFQEESIKWNIYPNPFFTSFKIDYKIEKEYKKLELEIFNILGQVIEKRILENEIGTISIEPITPAGIYFVVFKFDGKRSKPIKIIKAK
ncbi:MAG TPA: choice-of-anchor B family protein [Bacteroidetes bacterium]|nr:choice-of-anchor B family protein [Bacteroidota bacterium]